MITNLQNFPDNHFQVETHAEIYSRLKNGIKLVWWEFGFIVSFFCSILRTRRENSFYQFTTSMESMGGKRRRTMDSDERSSSSMKDNELHNRMDNRMANSDRLTQLPSSPSPHRLLASHLQPHACWWVLVERVEEAQRLLVLERLRRRRPKRWERTQVSANRQIMHKNFFFCQLIREFLEISNFFLLHFSRDLNVSLK